MENEESDGGAARGRRTAGLVDGPFTETKELLGAFRARRPSRRPGSGGDEAVVVHVDWRPVASS